MRILEHQDGSGEFVFGDCLFCAHEIVIPVDGRADWTHFRGYELKTKRKCWKPLQVGLVGHEHVAFPTEQSSEQLLRTRGYALVTRFEEMHDL